MHHCVYVCVYLYVFCPSINTMYSQEILHCDTDKIQFYICFGRDFLDMSESIDVGQDLQSGI